MPRTPSLENDDSIQFTLRLPPDCDAWIRSQAKKEIRSVNAQIVNLIRQAMQAQQAGSVTLTATGTVGKPSE